MARKPVKIVTDLQVKKRIKKVDSSDNVLFDVSGTVSNGHVSSSLPLTASNIYTPGNLTVDGVLSAKKMAITEVTTSVVYEQALSASINALYDVSASNAVAGQVLQWDGINWIAATVSGVGSSITASDVSGAITSSITNFATRSEITGALNSYATLTGVSSSFTTPASVSGAINNFATRSEITGALTPYVTLTGVSSSFVTPLQITGTLNNYLSISSASSSFAELSDLTASNITNFTRDVRAQFSAGPNIIINNGSITGSASGVSSVEVSGAITGALSNYATLQGVSSSFATLNNITSALQPYALISHVSASFTTPTQVSSSINNLPTRLEVTGALNDYLKISIASSSFAELSDLTASNITNFTNDVRSQFSAGSDIDITSGIISYTGAGGGGLTSVETSGNITGSGIIANPVTLKDPLIIGTITASFGFNGDLNGTASYASVASTASYVQNAQSASYVLNAISSSFSTNSLTASTSLIGAAEDGDYSDGLFTDINTTTPVGTVIDRFNEILKALAPAPAPNLTNAERSSGAVGLNRYLGFGSGINEVSGYTPVTASLTGLTNVAFANVFSATLGDSAVGYKRLGVYASPIVVTMSLNNATTANSDIYTNYPAKSFNVSADGVGTYKLEVNGISLSPTGSTSTVAATNTANFVLTTANTGTFITSGQGLDLFRHRTGTVGIPTSSWRNGHNYARVVHVSSLGTHTTSYIDWIYDPTGSSGVEQYVFTTPVSTSFSATGQRNLSGVKYYTNISYYLSSSVANYYKNTYNPSGITISSAVATAAAVTAATPTLNTDLAQISSLHTLATGRLLGTALTSSVTAANGLGKTNSASLITNTILFDNTTSPASTPLIEYFISEYYRASSGSYDTQSSASSAINSFPSISSLASGELAVYNGAIRYPTRILNAGNVTGSGVVHMIDNQPNYSGVTDNRGYFRVFQNGGSSVASFTIGITGSSGIKVVPYDSSLSANNVRIWIKIPGKTGWRDISTAAPGSTSGIALNDNVGCLQGSIVSGSTTSQHTVNLLTEAIAPSEYLLLKMEASGSWSNDISRITLTGL